MSNSMYDSPTYMKMLDDILARRKADRNILYLHEELALRNALASYGWYLVPNPDLVEGEEAWVHDSDLETYIIGYLTNDSVVFEPGEDLVRINRRDFSSTHSFVTKMREEFDKLVKEWY